MSNTAYGQIIDQGTAGYNLISNGSAAPTFQPYPASILNQVFGSGGTHTATLAESGTIYILEGTNTSLNVTLVAPTVSLPMIQYGFLNSSNQTSGAYTITIPSTISVYIPGTATPLGNGTASSFITSVPQAYIQLTSIAANTYEITGMVGTWKTAGGANLHNYVYDATPTSGQVLTSNGLGALPSFQTAGGGGGSGTVNNTASSIPQRDSTAALFYAPSQVIIDGSVITSVSPAVTASGTVYVFTGGNGVTSSINLPAVPAGTEATFTIIHQGGALSAQIQVQCNSTGVIKVGGSHNSGGISSGPNLMFGNSPGASMVLVGIPGTNNWYSHSMAGQWFDGSIFCGPLPAPTPSQVNSGTSSLTLNGTDVGLFMATGTTQTVNLPATGTGAGREPGSTYTIIKANTNAGTLTVGANSNTIKYNSGGTAVSVTTSASCTGATSAYNSITFVATSGSTFCVTAITGTWTFT